MKKLLTIILILLSITAMAQTDTCGRWQATRTQNSGWTTIDTVLRKNLVRTGQPRDWVEEDPYPVATRASGLTNCPCRVICPPDEVFYQERVDRVTGIRQRREVVVRYEYVQRQSGYKRAVDSLRRQ